MEMLARLYAKAPCNRLSMMRCGVIAYAILFSLLLWGAIGLSIMLLSGCFRHQVSIGPAQALESEEVSQLNSVTQNEVLRDQTRLLMEWSVLRTVIATLPCPPGEICYPLTASGTMRRSGK